MLSEPSQKQEEMVESEQIDQPESNVARCNECKYVKFSNHTINVIAFQLFVFTIQICRILSIVEEILSSTIYSNVFVKHVKILKEAMQEDLNKLVEKALTLQYPPSEK